TPGYVLDLDLLARLFPEARFVHVIRDGRDVALSYLERRFGPGDLGQAALYWRRRVTAGQEGGARLGPHRYQELRYEELIDDPEGIVKRVCTFIHLEYDPSMLRYFERADELTAAAADPDAHQSLALPPTHGLRDWRTQMEPSDVALFEGLAGGTLASLGYDRVFDRAKSATVLKAAASRGRWFKERLVSLVRRAINRGRRAVGRPEPR
ncbi:MAG: sulfotransferase, partial [Acidimicrobiia bacterium]